MCVRCIVVVVVVGVFGRRKKNGFVAFEEVVCGVFVTRKNDDDDYGEKSTPDDSYYMGIHTNALLSRFGDLSISAREKKKKKKKKKKKTTTTTTTSSSSSSS